MKQNVAQRIAFALLLTLTAAMGRGADVDPLETKVKAALAGLTSGDPAVRDASAKAIVDFGAEARRAVFEASKSDDPELKARASELLLKLPWYLPDDSPGVRQVLDQYGKLDTEKRIEAVGALAELTLHGFEALARLVAEEPSDDVKWAIVAAARKVYREDSLEQFRKLDFDSDNAPLLAAAGHAWLSKNVEKGSKLLRRALRADLDRPANDMGEVEVTYERLQNLALLDGKYEEVVRLLRQRAQRGATDDDGEASRAVMNLFAAHAKFGPFPGLEKDLETYQTQLEDPRVMFAVGKIYEKCGQNLLAAATFRGAFLADLVSVQERFNQGDFLLHHGWHDLAEGQFNTVFDLSTDHSSERDQMIPELDDANANFRLAQIAAAREDEQAAGDHMKAAMDLHYKARGQLRGATDATMWQDIHWHYLRAAREKGDKVELNKRLTALLNNTPSNPDIANDMVPILREQGRTEDAKALFDEVLKNLQEADNAPADHPMPKNNMAWLCARCGEKKEDALKWAKAATKAMPDNAAFLDTLAEAEFLNGNFAEAARQEARVVAARPGDRFLMNQLKRFEEAAAKRKGH